MNNDIQPFTFPDTGQQVRTFSLDGEPWFVAADVAKALELGNMHSSLSRLDDDEKGLHTVDTLGGVQQAAVVNEPGLYSLILRSRRPEAKQFKRWITHEVLPSIRKAGSYAAPTQDIATLSRREIALLIIEAEDARVEAEQKVAELEPKAEAHDALMTAPGALLVRNAAKTLGMKERNLRVFLLEQKLLFTRQALCGTVQYDFYAQLSNHFRSTLTTVDHTWGECVHTTIHVTPMGMGLIRKRLAAQSTEIAIAAGGVR